MFGQSDWLSTNITTDIDMNGHPEGTLVNFGSVLLSQSSGAPGL